MSEEEDEDDEGIPLGTILISSSPSSSASSSTSPRRRKQSGEEERGRENENENENERRGLVSDNSIENPDEDEEEEQQSVLTLRFDNINNADGPPTLHARMFSYMLPLIMFMRNSFSAFSAVMRMNGVLASACVLVAAPWVVWSMFTNAATLSQRFALNETFNTSLTLDTIETFLAIDVAVLIVPLTFALLFTIPDVPKKILISTNSVFLLILNIFLCLIAFQWDKEFDTQMYVGYGFSVALVIVDTYLMGKTVANFKGAMRIAFCIFLAVAVQLINDGTIATSFACHKGDESYRFFIRTIVNPLYFRIIILFMKIFIGDVQAREPHIQSFLLLGHCLNKAFLGRIYSFSLTSPGLVFLSSIITAAGDLIISALYWNREYCLKLKLLQTRPNLHKYFKSHLQNDIFYCNYLNISRIVELVAIIVIFVLRMLYTYEIHLDADRFALREFTIYSSLIQLAVEMAFQCFGIYYELSLGFKITNLAKDYRRFTWYFCLMTLAEATMTSWKAFYIMNDKPLFYNPNNPATMCGLCGLNLTLCNKTE